MNIDLLTKILDRNFKGRVWGVARNPGDGFVPLCGFFVRPHPGQTVPADGEVEAWEADEIDRDVAQKSGVLTTVRRGQIDDQIAALEHKQTRAVREHVLGDTGARARLRDIDNQIQALRAQRP